MSISAVILTKNEEKNVGACLTSLSWADERIVIDDDSTDKTVEIAKELHAIVFTHALDDDFSKQRNFGLLKAKGNWIFFVDADELVTKGLAEEIRSVINGVPAVIHGYLVKREDHMWGKILKHGEQGKGLFLRLIKKETGKWTGAVHEVLQVTGPTAILAHPLLHYPHPTIGGFLEEVNFYSTLRAKELYNEGIRTNSLDILSHLKAKFIQDYFVKLGFLDGTPGFIVAMLMSFHSFLVRGKLWQLTKK